MNNIKIVVACMVQNDEFWITPCLKSILPIADKILIIDGGSTDNTLSEIDKLNDDRIEIRHIRFCHELLTSDGRQRQEYLNILKNC